MEIMGPPKEVLAKYTRNHDVVLKGSAVLAKHGYYYPDQLQIKDFDLFVADPLLLATRLCETPNAEAKIQYNPHRITILTFGQTFDVLDSHDMGSIHNDCYGCSTADSASVILNPDLNPDLGYQKFSLSFIHSHMLFTHPDSPRSIRIAVRALWATTLTTTDGANVTCNFSRKEKEWIKVTTEMLLKKPDLNQDSHNKLQILMSKYWNNIPQEFRYMI